MINIPKTELIYKNSEPIDKLSIGKGLKLMIKEQKDAAEAVNKSMEIIEKTIIKIIQHLTVHKKGRIIYVGAGTSGRIGVQDGVELFPTFNWPKSRLDFVIAGGQDALLNSIEGAEDNILDAQKVANKKKINREDVVIGLAASGNTPFTCKVMEEAQNKKALTVSISNNPKGEILNFGKFKIILNTNEEVIAGSTRLKAGTSQKICLNIISSIVMTKLGYIKDGRMVNLVATNKKLIDRKLRIENYINSETQKI